MRILFVSNERQKDDFNRNLLSPVAEKDSIYFVNSIEDAHSFINNRLVKHQEPLDLLILCQQITSPMATDFKEFINKDPSRIYSKRDFNLLHLPCVLVLEDSETPGFYEKHHFSAITYKPTSETQKEYQRAVISSIQNWRRQVFDELDNLGIRLNSGKVDYSYYFSSSRKKNVKTKILSNNFKSFPRPLRYYWLDINNTQIAAAIDDYVKFLKVDVLGKKKKNELKYHRFFNSNPFFLTRDNYSRIWYEVNLKSNQKNSLKPDFSLRTNMNYKTDLCVIEVKVPNEPLLRKTNFHPTFYSKIFTHFAQVSAYKERLEKGEYKDSINSNFGFIPRNIDYNLLIGRREQKEENQYLIEKRRKELGQNHLSIVSFDEILDYQLKFLERFDLLRII